MQETTPLSGNRNLIVIPLNINDKMVKAVGLRGGLESKIVVFQIVPETPDVLLGESDKIIIKERLSKLGYEVPINYNYHQNG